MILTSQTCLEEIFLVDELRAYIQILTKTRLIDGASILLYNLTTVRL